MRSWSKQVGRDDNGNYIAALAATPAGRVFSPFAGDLCELLPTERVAVTRLGDLGSIPAFVAAHPTNGTIVTGGDVGGGTAALELVGADKQSQRVELPLWGLRWGEYSADGSWFACGGSSAVAMQRTGTTKWITADLRGSGRGAVSLDGTQVARFNDDGLQLLEIGKKKAKLVATDAWGDLYASADGWVSRSSRGEIYGLDRRGKLRWQATIKGDGDAAARSTDGKLFAAVADGGVYVFDTATGKQVQQYKRSRTIARACAFLPDGTILVGTDAGLEAYGSGAAKPEKKQKVERPTTIAAAWKLIESLDHGAQLAAAATAKKTKHAKLIGELPPSLKGLLARHDGDDESGLLFGWSLMCTVEIGDEQAFWKDYSGSHKPPKAKGVKDGWWQSGWFPFAKSGGGDFLFVDTAPAKGGAVGQVFVQTMDPPKRRVLSPSLEQWFCRFAQLLANGEQDIEKLLEDS